LSKRAAIPDPATRPTIKPEEAFRLLGCGRTSGYEMIRQGTFPVPVLRLGRTIKIPTAPLLELLGLRPAGRSDAA
jgi:predicted DNA-binding transcriptional regulator AlpA